MSYERTKIAVLSFMLGFLIGAIAVSEIPWLQPARASTDTLAVILDPDTLPAPPQFKPENPIAIQDQADRLVRELDLAISGAYAFISDAFLMRALLFSEGPLDENLLFETAEGLRVPALGAIKAEAADFVVLRAEP